MKTLLGSDGQYRVFYDEITEIVEVETHKGIKTFEYRLIYEPRFGFDSDDTNNMLVKATQIFNENKDL